jgi:hypothetical protein
MCPRLLAVFIKVPSGINENTNKKLKFCDLSAVAVIYNAHVVAILCNI